MNGMVDNAKSAIKGLNTGGFNLRSAKLARDFVLLCFPLALILMATRMS